MSNIKTNWQTNVVATIASDSTIVRVPAPARGTVRRIAVAARSGTGTFAVRVYNSSSPGLSLTPEGAEVRPSPEVSHLMFSVVQPLAGSSGVAEAYDLRSFYTSNETQTNGTPVSALWVRIYGAVPGAFDISISGD